MGRRGPRPTPTPILAMTGSKQLYKRKGQIAPEVVHLPPPKYLSDRERAVWIPLVAKLFRLGVLADIDEDALALFCRLVCEAQDLEAFLAKHGETWIKTSKSEDGTTRIESVQAYPQTYILRQKREQIMRLHREFGMTPASRVGLETTKAGDVKGVTQFARKRG